MSSFDKWLERPYTQRAIEEEEFEKWCDINDEDPDDDTAFSRYQEFLETLEDIGPDPDEMRELEWERQMEERGL